MKYEKPATAAYSEIREVLAFELRQKQGLFN